MYIVHQLTGQKIECEVVKALKKDFTFIKKHFSFDWNKEFMRTDVFKLVIRKNHFIQGLILILDGDDHLFLKLIELHQQNIGKDKRYGKVAGNLIAFASLVALEKFDGFMVAESKSLLIDHYCSTYGFQRIGFSNRIISYPENSKKIVDLYYGK